MAIEFFTVEIGRVGHRKWRALAKLGHVREAAATTFWLAMMERCSEAQNGGRVPAAWPSRDLPAWPLEVVSQAAIDLTDHGLLEEHPEGGWQIHDYQDHQHPLLSARAEEAPPQPEDEPPPGLSAEERKRWLAARRARRSRASKRDASGSQRDVERDATTTERDAKRDAKRDGDGRSVTAGASRRHAKTSRSVTLSGTPRHASPFFSTVREETQTSDARAHESVTQKAERDAESVTRDGERDATERDAATESVRPSGVPSVGWCEVVRGTIAKAYRERDLVLPPECSMGTAHHQRIVTLARVLTDTATLEAALRGFFASPRVANASFPLRWLETNPNEYVLAGRGSSSTTSAAPPGAPQAPAGGVARWMPGQPEAVTEKTMAELVEALPGLAEALIEKTGGHHGGKPPELADPAKHEPTWRSLATWACSRAYRCRLGDRETPPQPGYLVSRAFKVAVRGWLADPLANGRDGVLDMRVLIDEPERMWSEGRAVSSS